MNIDIAEAQTSLNILELAAPATSSAWDFTKKLLFSSQF